TEAVATSAELEGIFNKSSNHFEKIYHDEMTRYKLRRFFVDKARFRIDYSHTIYLQTSSDYLYSLFRFAYYL
ncbi:hypothetical protein ACJX0J_026178, partial [Zea mays]